MLNAPSCGKTKEFSALWTMKGGKKKEIDWRNFELRLVYATFYQEEEIKRTRKTHNFTKAQREAQEIVFLLTKEIEIGITTCGRWRLGKKDKKRHGRVILARIAIWNREPKKHRKKEINDRLQNRNINLTSKIFQKNIWKLSVFDSWLWKDIEMILRKRMLMKRRLATTSGIRFSSDDAFHRRWTDTKRANA